MIDRRDFLPAGLLLLAALALGLPATAIAYDDAWITYRYAFHLATGQGFVYNLGERFLGTTAPGYAVLLAVPGAVAPGSIPGTSAVICILSLVAAGLGLYAFGRQAQQRVAGFVAGALFVVNPVAVEAFGGEMLPQIALAVWAFVAQASGRATLAVGLACLATIIRPDGLLVLAIVGVVETWRKRGLPWRPIAVAAVMLGIWFGALWLYFGWPLPQTLGAKSAQRVSGIWRPLGTDLVAWFGALSAYGPTIFGSRPAPGFTPMLWLAALGLPAHLVFRAWWPVLAWPVLYMVVYRELHLPFYHWYAVPPLLFVVVSAGVAAQAIAALVALIARLGSGRSARPAPGRSRPLPGSSLPASSRSSSRCRSDGTRWRSRAPIRTWSSARTRTSGSGWRGRPRAPRGSAISRSGFSATTPDAGSSTRWGSSIRAWRRTSRAATSCTPIGPTGPRSSSTTRCSFPSSSASSSTSPGSAPSTSRSPHSTAAGRIRW